MSAKIPISETEKLVLKAIFICQFIIDLQKVGVILIKTSDQCLIFGRGYFRFRKMSSNHIFWQFIRKTKETANS